MAQLAHGAKNKAVHIAELLALYATENKEDIEVTLYQVGEEWGIQAGKRGETPFSLKEMEFIHADMAEQFASNLAKQHGFTYRGVMPNEKEMALQQVIERYSKEILQTVETYVSSDKQGSTYLTKNEMEHMLHNHFIRIENRLEQYFEQPAPKVTFAERFETFKNDLQQFAKDLKQSLVERSTKTKEAVFDQVDVVKLAAEAKIKAGVSSLNERIKDFTKVVDVMLEPEVGVTKSTKKIKKQPELER
ncbi:hypothetical protein A0U40_03540 [[Bacillus] sp. KCTC 13219]|nr:hypothetical protein A0U40_03540 [[Bacillus] sp. KCTC 13219]